MGLMYPGVGYYQNEVILKSIWVTAMILNFEFKIKSVNKQQETMGRKLFMESHLIFLNAILHLESRVRYPKKPSTKNSANII